jgi:hypothetical protein
MLCLQRLMRKCLNKHNSYSGGSTGTGGTHHALAPWGFLSMITGFHTRHEIIQTKGKGNGKHSFTCY